jgi:hypothetical protein
MKTRTAILAGLTLIVVVFVIAYGFEGKAKIRSGPSEPHRQSLSQMRSIAQACFVYAMDNDDQFPDASNWNALLISSGILDEGYVESPAQVDGAESYFMMPDVELYDQDAILLYENPDHWPDFVNVIWGDASGDQIPHDEFHRRLEAQQNSSSSGP